MNIFFFRLVRKVYHLFPLFVFLSSMGQVISLSELAHKITKKKTDKWWSEFQVAMHLFGLQIVSSIYHKKMRNKEPHRGFWGFIFCIFLVSLLLHTWRRPSLHARKVDTYPFRKFYNFIHYNGCKCISIKPDCLHSCYLQQCTLLFFVWTTEKVKLSLFFVV